VNMNTNPLGMSPKAAAAAFRIPHRTLRGAIREGRIVAHTAGRRSILLVSDIEAWIKAQPPTKSPRKSCQL
jgi:hypothetical protein